MFFKIIGDLNQILKLKFFLRINQNVLNLIELYKKCISNKTFKKLLQNFHTFSDASF